jgi:large subunit ribosomal protein L18
VYFSNANVYAQVIDDEAGRTIVSASTKEKGYGAGKANIENAIKVGAALAERALAKNISDVVFDRAGFIYHGKVKALADAAREKGLKF